MKKFIFGILIIMSLSRCEEKMVIIPIYEAPTGNKIVLVEDLTGVRCPNCPVGSERLKILEEKYNHKIVIVGIHGSFLTIPVKEGDYDLRNEFSVSIENSSKPFFGKPASVIDRTIYDSDGDMGISVPDKWEQYIVEALGLEVDIDLTPAVTYDASSRKIDLSVEMIPQKNDLNGNYNISVMLIESGIVTDQKGPQGTIEDYTHHDVLRTMLTDVSGNSVSISDEQFNETSVSFESTLPDEDGGWIANNMDVVVFISNADSREVIQTKKIKLVE